MSDALTTLLQQAPEMDANTAWKQIPMMTKMACGARDAVAGRKYLMFTVGQRSTRILVTMSHMDTYSVHLLSVRKRMGVPSHTLKKSVEDVYSDNLGSVVYDLVNT